jgi:hypothetical protein
MSQPGIGAMLHAIGGWSKNDPSKYVGRTIKAASLHDNELEIAFEDGATIHVWDNLQICCENRYMTSDDDPSSLVGRQLTGIVAKEGTSEEDECGVEREIVFVEVQTDGGFITLVNHNEHNGYYGGFGLTITEDDERGRWGSR